MREGALREAVKDYDRNMAPKPSPLSVPTALILYSFKYIKSSQTPMEVQSIFCYTNSRLISSFQNQLLN